MKKNRALYAALLIMSFIFIYFYGGKIPYTIFFIVVMLPVISFIYTLIVYVRFKFIQDIGRKIAVKGDRVSLTINITNEDIILYPYIKVNFHGAGSLFANQLASESFSLSPFKKSSFIFELECRYRGCYPVGIKSFEIEDLLGIFKLTYLFSESKDITIYPRIIHLEKFNIGSVFLSDSHAALSSGIEDMATVSSIRKYAGGDSLKRIHWKLSAKMRELYVKNYQSTTQTNAILFLDLEKSNYSFEYGTIIEDKVIECAAAIVYYCLENWLPIDFVYYNSEIVSVEAKDPGDFESIYSLLSKIKFNQSVGIKDLLQIYLSGGIKNTNIIIFTSKINYDLYNELYKINFLGYKISLIYVSPESLTGEKDSEADNIVSSLPELGVSTYRVGIEDDIKLILER